MKIGCGCDIDILCHCLDSGLFRNSCIGQKIQAEIIDYESLKITENHKGCKWTYIFKLSSVICEGKE